MAILGLPAITPSLVQRFRASRERQVRKKHRKSRLRHDDAQQRAWASYLANDTQAVMEERQLPKMDGMARALVLNETCSWLNNAAHSAVFGHWFLENWKEPLTGLIIFYLRDQRTRHENSVEIQWQPKRQKPELQCKVVRGDDIKHTEDGETYHLSHEVIVEVTVINPEHPPMCVGYNSRYLSSIRWTVLGETEHYHWWDQCQKLLRQNWLRTFNSAKVQLAELVASNQELKKEFDPEKVVWPLNEDQINSLLTILGYQPAASRRLLRVAWAEQHNEVPPLLLRERTLEIKAEKGVVEQTIKDSAVEPITNNEPNFDIALPATQACLFGGVGCRPWEQVLLEAVVDVFDAFADIKECLPSLQDVFRLGEKRS